VSRNGEHVTYFKFLERRRRRNLQLVSTRGVGETADTILGAVELSLIDDERKERAGYNPYDHEVTP
jgi:hypothetical protein